MEYKFLNKVLDQIVRETRIDDDGNNIIHPVKFSISYLRPNINPYVSIRIPYSFTSHCQEVYGLNDNEVKYVWYEYKRILNDKFKRKYWFFK
jgi:hypothetical protein